MKTQQNSGPFPFRFDRVVATAWMACLVLASGAIPARGQAQDQPATANPPNLPETPVLMSAFQVSTTQDTGYVDSHSATAFKTDQSLITIPQPVMVITRDMIADTGYYIASDILQFAGVGNYYRGETYVIRGARVSYDYLDELRGIMPHQDAVFIDSFEVVRGPAAVFYPDASLGGVVLKTTRKPMQVEHNTLSVSVDGFGSVREEMDSTGPIGKLGDGVLAYRLIGANQGGTSYFNNVGNSVEALHPSLQFTDAKNKFLVAYDYQAFTFLDNAQGIMSPDGAMYTGQGGWKEEENDPPGLHVVHRFNAVRLEYTHAMADNWELKMQGAVQNYKYWGLDNYPASVDLTRNSITWNIFNDKDTWKDFAYLTDITGKYDVFGLIGRSTMGGYFEKRDYLFANMDPPSSYPTAWTGPLNAPNLSYINYPNWNTWTLDKTHPYVDTPYGNSFDALSIDVYYQQEIAVIPDRISLVGTGTWRLLESTTLQSGSGNDTSQHPALDQTLSTGLYRAGAVLQVIPRQVAIYGLVSTNTLSNGNAVTINGNPLPPEQGKGTEVGIKTDLFDGRLSSTTAVYRIALSNVGENAGVSPVTGVFYSIAAAGTVQQGWDTDLEFKVTNNFQFVGTFYHGKNVDQTGQPLDNSIRGVWSVYGRYGFDNASALKGLLIGGGAADTWGRVDGTEGVYVMSAQQAAGLTANGLIKARDAVKIDCFARYRFSRHWTANFGIDNVLDKNYPIGSEDGIFTDPSPPRDFSGKVIFSF